ncbi:O-antigen ligase-related [Flavobacteriaceae bacterium]
MKSSTQYSYFFLLLIHAFIGLVAFVVPFTTKIYSFSILVYGIYYIIKTQNRNNEALVMASYAVGVEVLLRMTDGMLINEFGKYSVMLFLFMGMFYKGFSSNSFVYWIFLLLLIPSIVLATVTLNFGTDVRKAIFFNISGPVCLGFSAIYCYKRSISLDRLMEIISVFCFPLVAVLAYVFIYNPSVQDVVTGTGSNFATSGGFGPNQVATILGLGIFVFFVQLLLNSNSQILKIVNAALIIVFAYRGIVTFSRGGVISAVMMTIVFIIVLYFRANLTGKAKISTIAIMATLVSIGIWGYTSLQTGGLIDKRYSNQDAVGRVKKDRLGGREAIANTELQMFLDNPILGVGVGKNKEYREEETGIVAASHNEITRMLAEHGSLGILGLLILFLTPLILYFQNRENIFALCFLVFWLLTINHAAMRMAAPAFIYALSLLKINNVQKPALHRE